MALIAMFAIVVLSIQTMRDTSAVMQTLEYVWLPLSCSAAMGLSAAGALIYLPRGRYHLVRVGAE